MGWKSHQKTLVQAFINIVAFGIIIIIGPWAVELACK
jgi:hypothetical protein